MQNFIVLEFTRNASGNIAVYPSAQSPVHGAALLNWDGFELAHEYYEHTPEPTPEPEPEEPTE